jgi:hypothetical protein
MKKLLVLIVILAGAYFVYHYFYNKSFLEVKETVIVSQASGLDIHAGPTPPLKYAYIEGTIKNNGDKSLSDVLIIYTIGYDTVSAMVGYLMPGGSAVFNTNSIRVRSANPQYTLKDIKYDKTGL